MHQPEHYMRRCLQLARLGQGYVSPNPMVGSVLVYNDRSIGEGYHMRYGRPHAEVNCINSVKDEDRQLIPQSTIYVSLEPCAHFGKTPPCADLIIQHGIKQVVVGCRDPFPLVDGKGIERLQDAGVQVTTSVLEDECITLNKRFFTFHQQHRPFVLLKWAQTANHKIGKTGERLHISNEFSQRFVHQLRSHQQAILVGTNTALADDPSLDARYSAGPSPIRMVIDLENKLPRNLKVFNGQQRTIIFNSQYNRVEGNNEWCLISNKHTLVQEVLNTCYQKQIQSILVEGGAATLQSFIDAGAWDEAVVITNRQMFTDADVNAPILSKAVVTNQTTFITDSVTFYKHQP